jgi:hypothetical protein
MPPAELGRWQPIIAEAARRFDVPAAWIERVIHVESRGRTTVYGRPIRSPAGAIGLMQLMPATWGDMRMAYGLATNPDDPHDNILAGTAYLRLMYDRFGYPGLFAAYNAGPARYAVSLAGGKPLPIETIAYLAAVTSPGSVAPSMPSEKPLSSPIDAAPPALFVFRYGRSPAPAAEPTDQQPASLFVVRTSVP